MKHMPVIEHEYLIGPLPHPGMEVIVKFNTDIVSKDVFFTGS